MEAPEITFEEFTRFMGQDGYDLDDPADMVTAAAWVVGPNVGRIAQFLGRPRSWCSSVAKSLREQGVWRGGHVIVSDATDTEALAVELSLQTLVAKGFLEIKS